MALVGRDGELAAIEALLSTTSAGGSATLLLTGPAGIGKSVLLRLARRQARARGWAVLSANAGQLERDFAFGVVRQLFEPIVHRSGVPAELADTVFAPVPRVTTESAAAESAFSAMQGLYWLTADLAAMAPLFLAIDDLQWADAPSGRWLRHLLRRVEGLPIALVATARTGEATLFTDGQQDLSALFQRTVHLDGLALPAVEQLSTAILGRAPDPSFTTACQEATGGNPFLLHALLRNCRDEHIEPTAEQARHIHEFGPAEVADIVHGMLASLGPPAERLGTALSVLGDTVDLALLAAVAEVEPTSAEVVLRRLAELELLRRNGNSVFFTHSIIPAALTTGIRPSVREQLHLTAADWLRRNEAPAEQTAAHLLAIGAGRAPWALAVLRAAAELALARGAPESAARYLQRARAERMPPADRARLLLTLGRAELSVDLTAAVKHLEQALDGPLPGPERAAAVIDLVRALCVQDDYPRAIAVLPKAADVIRPLDPALALRLDVEHEYLGMLVVPTATRPAPRPFRPEPALAANTPAELAVAGLLGFRAVAEGNSRATTLRHAHQALREGLFPRDESFVYIGTLMAVYQAGEPERALAYCDAALEHARLRGSVFSRAVACTIRAEVNYRLGRVTDSHVDAQASLDARTQLGLDHRRTHAAVAIGRLVEVLLDMGQLTEAASALRQVDAEGPLPGHLYYSWVLMARGRLRVLTGDVQDGLADYLECGRRLLLCHLKNPAIFGWRSAAAEAHFLLGQSESARELATEELRLARDWGAPDTVGAALRVCGVVTGGQEGLALLRESATTLTASPARLEQARTLTELGAVLRGTGNAAEARRVLRQAVDLARACGAPALASRAEAELRAAGAKPRTPVFSGTEALTPSERQVALLAAEGRSNREIAERLLVGQRTVEVHLTHAYRKLRIRGRAELAEALHQ